MLRRFVSSKAFIVIISWYAPERVALGRLHSPNNSTQLVNQDELAIVGPVVGGETEVARLSLRRWIDCMCRDRISAAYRLENPLLVLRTVQFVAVDGAITGVVYDILVLIAHNLLVRLSSITSP